ncbi:hypothetical protein NBRC116493_19810 [Aurantivibrio infirmus]
MRISTQHIYSIADIGIAKAQQAIVKTEEQIASGKRVVNPADDPIAATVILQIRESLARTDQFRKNIDVAQNIIEREEVALDGVVNLLHRVRELTVQSGNTAVLSDSDYEAIAIEIDSRLEEMLNLANTQNPGGDYVFAGYQGGSQPFTSDGAGNYSYHGDEGSIAIQVTTNARVQVSDSGQRLFENVASAENTIRTSTSSSNQSNPPVLVSVGQVVDQATYDQFYPEDMEVTFNAVANVVPAATNYTITERSTGRVIVQNQLYQSGEDIVANGVSFTISGIPFSGTAATAATLQFGVDAAQNFAGDETGESLTLRVGGITETLVIGSNVTNDADIVTELTTGANAARLANLGVTVNNLVSPPRFESANGLNIEIDPGNNSGANILAAVGINTGTASANGVLAAPGDKILIESENQQSLLTTLSRLSEALHGVEAGSPQTRALVEDVVANTLVVLDNAETTVNSVLGEVGARLNTLDSSRELHLDSDLLNKKVLSDIEDLDFSEAATRLSLQTFILQAAQQSFVRVSGLSLFNLLR